MADVPRIDLSSLHNLAGTGTDPDPSGLLRWVQERMTRSRQLRERGRELVGRAQNDDDTIEAAFTPDAGLQQLTINPRAMRMSADDLAAEIVRVAAAARDDYARQRGELADELGVDGIAPDPEQAQADVHAVVEQYRRGAGDMQALIERYRAALGR